MTFRVTAMATSLLVMSLATTSSDASGTVRRVIHLPEEAAIGATIANTAELLHLLPRTSDFQLIKQQLVTSPSYDAAAREHRKWLSVDRASGAITVRHRVDRERACGDSETCLIRLQIFVGQKQKLLSLDVIIGDVNDNKPVFPVESIEVNISESARIGDFVSLDQFMAKDADMGNNSMISYSVIPSKQFAVVQFRDEMDTPHLQLTIIEELDFEISPSHRLVLTAKDGGKPGTESSVPLMVRVQDENDNRPEFEKQDYVIHLRENLPPGYVITRLHAFDADSGALGTIRYSVSQRNKPQARHLVEVDAITGDVTLGEKLDREKHDGLRILIEARDTSPTNQLTGGAWLIVHVTDVNDNSPVISVSLIPPFNKNTAYVSEDSPDETIFAYVTASDADLGANAEVTMTIKSVTKSQATEGDSGAEDIFSLSSAGLLGIKKSLDREKTSGFTIVISACDRGELPRCSSASVKVVVLDVNDHAPIFVQSEWLVNIAEDTPVGKFVTTIEAIDNDSINSPALMFDEESGKVMTSSNGDVVYSIVNGDGTFSIEPHTGRVNLVRPLDREQLDGFKLTIVAQDSGRPVSLSSSCELIIKVSDVNDNHPLFTNPPEDNMTVYATILRDDIVMRIQAIDYDSGASGLVDFAIVSEDGVAKSRETMTSSIFILDPTNGDLRLNMTSDDKEELLGPHRITIEARDQGYEQLISLRHINVIITDMVVLPTLAPPPPKVAATSTSHIIIIVALASSLVLLTVVIIVVYLRCRRHSKKMRTYSCHEVSPEDQSEWGRASVSSLRHKSYEETRRSVSSDVSESSKLWGERRNDSVLTTSHTDVTNASRSDVIASRQLRSSTRSLGRVNSHNMTKHFPEKHQSVPHLLTSSSHDGDSGRGDSDPDVASYDVNYDHDLSRSHFSPRNTPGSPHGSGVSTPQAGSRCTPQCLRYGHSDTCWMPPNDSAGRYPAYVDNNKSSLYVQLCPMPQGHTNPEQQNPSLQPIPEQRQMRYFCSYPASELSSIYSNVIAPPTRLYSPLRHQLVTSFDQHQPTSRLSPISSLSSPVSSVHQHPEATPQRINRCVTRRDVAPDDDALTSPGSVPTSPKRKTNPLVRSASADFLSEGTSGRLESLRRESEARSPASDVQSDRSKVYGSVSMRETEEIVQNIEKLLES